MAALLVSMLAGCSSDPYADRVSREDERIMRVMVDISCKLGVEPLVISDLPAAPRHTEEQDAGSRNLQFGIDLDRRVAHSARWPVEEVCPMVRVVPGASIEAVMAHDTQSWEKFIATFHAQSLMTISLPVYSPDGKRAVVYTAGDCPYTCGAGFYHELQKTSSGWRIVNSVNAWSS